VHEVKSEGVDVRFRVETLNPHVKTLLPHGLQESLYLGQLGSTSAFDHSPLPPVQACCQEYRHALEEGGPASGHRCGLCGNLVAQLAASERRAGQLARSLDDLRDAQLH